MDYYYGKEAGQYAFYRIPKLLIANKRFENMKEDLGCKHEKAGKLLAELEMSFGRCTMSSGKWSNGSSGISRLQRRIDGAKTLTYHYTVFV